MPPNELHLLLYRTLSRRALELSNMFFAQALAYRLSLKPRCGSLALSVMWYVLTVSQVGAMARFEWNLLSVNIRSKSYRVDV